MATNAFAPTELPPPAPLPRSLRPTMVPAETDHSQCWPPHEIFDGERVRLRRPVRGRRRELRRALVSQTIAYAVSGHACSLKDCDRCRPYVVCENGDVLSNHATFAEALAEWKRQAGRMIGRAAVVRVVNFENLDLGCPSGLTEDEEELLDAAHGEWLAGRKVG